MTLSDELRDIANRHEGKGTINDSDLDGLHLAADHIDALEDEIDALRKQRRLMAEYIALDATDPIWRAEAKRILESKPWRPKKRLSFCEAVEP